VEVAIELVLADEQAVVEESELDEMWSYVGKKTNPRWLWHAIDRKTGPDFSR
jgi:insertion element IS1 protein InsB